MSEATCYVARKRACGCAVAVCVDNPEHLDYVRDFIKGFLEDMLEDGFVLDRMTISEFHKLRFLNCKCETKSAASPA